MSLNIKNQETERLARLLAQKTGESVTQAVTVAINDRLNKIQSQDEESLSERISKIQKIGKSASKLWVEPYQSSEHGDLLYDKDGLPK